MRRLETHRAGKIDELVADDAAILAAPWPPQLDHLGMIVADVLAWEHTFVERC